MFFLFLLNLIWSFAFFRTLRANLKLGEDHHTFKYLSLSLQETQSWVLVKPLWSWEDSSCSYNLIGPHNNLQTKSTGHEFSHFTCLIGTWKIKVTLTLKAPNKNCSRRHFNFLLLSFKENKAWFFRWILCLAENSFEISSLIFSEKQWKIFMAVVCCSHDWCFKG